MGEVIELKARGSAAGPGEGPAARAGCAPTRRDREGETPADAAPAWLVTCPQAFTHLVEEEKSAPRRAGRGERTGGRSGRKRRAAAPRAGGEALQPHLREEVWEQDGETTRAYGRRKLISLREESSAMLPSEQTHSIQIRVAEAARRE